MDEAEKYQLRLEAIAEKRRQQDEQEKVRRELEEERLRLQQLKRKSLRDQWLMEGAPLSPASLAAQGPRSPLWGPQAQEMEMNIDKLQAESQRLADESEKQQQQLEDGQEQQTVKVKVSEAGEGMIRDVVQNGETIETADASEVNMIQSPLVDGSGSVLTNGGGGGGAFEDENHEAVSGGVLSARAEPGLSLGVSEAEPGLSLGVSEAEPGLSLGISEAEPDRLSLGVSEAEPGLSLGVLEAEPGRLSLGVSEAEPEINLNGAEDEGTTLVTRAECVIVTDEGDDDDDDDNAHALVKPHEGVSVEHGNFVEEVVKMASESTPEAQLDAGAGDEEEGDESTEAEETQLQPAATVLEGATMASVPVYAETQASSVTPRAEVEAGTSPRGARDPTAVAAATAAASGRFQEVPLGVVEPQRSEVAAEQEPLLSRAKKAPSAVVVEGGGGGGGGGGAEANSAGAVDTDTRSPARAEAEAAPKHKSCQCCSLM